MSRQKKHRLGEIYTVYNDEKIKAEKTFRNKQQKPLIKSYAKNKTD